MGRVLALMLLVMSLVTAAMTHVSIPTRLGELNTVSTADFPQVVKQNADALVAVQSTNANNALVAYRGGNSTVQIGNEKVTPPAWSGNWLNFGLMDSTTIRFNEPFNVLRVEWLANVPVRTALQIDVRASGDGQNWTLWELLNQSGQVARFDSNKLYLYAEYRIRMFSADEGISPEFMGISLAANSQNVNTFFNGNNANLAMLAANQPATYKVYGTRQGMVGGRTASGHVIVPNDRFVSLPSWRSLSKKGSSDYQVRIVAPNGKSGVAPVYDVGPWSNQDNYWTAPRDMWNDLPVGMPMAEKAFFNNYNNGKNEFGDDVVNPSSIDVGDGTWWTDLGLGGAGWKDGNRLAVSFLWGANITPVQLSNVQIKNIGSGNATISWNTNVPTTDWLEYGFDTNYRFHTTPGTFMGTNHVVYLGDLAPNRTYNLRARTRDIIGQEVASDKLTFTTGSGMTTQLTNWQTDQGLKTTISPDFGSVKIEGKRVVDSYWNDNPVNNYTAGASTIPGNVGNSGGLDVEFAPICDANGQNCNFGSGSGYKAYVQIVNDVGEEVRVGVISDSIISPNGLTIMVEGTTANGPLWRYSDPNLLDPRQSHHFLIVWDGNQVRVKVDYGSFLDPTPITTSGIKWNFAAAARYKGDSVNVNLKEINFSWGSVNPAPAPVSQ
ncbi:MAG: fibronectin type III domain-containing protein [Chloroflexi bacterium]|uniref:Fibronectin type III domain-containing protein n=2 Tax=Candidatus Chlorohelix allophototropha TaxID=3003348 RepID=A0A8T7M6W5_9CHLR|nr:fibronectin type III domain-containing protein [Chloroflexota bacterium]